MEEATASTALLLVHAASCWFMAGVIWIVQVVHYPLFAGVGEAGYARYQAEHMRRITWVVLPTMAIELATAALLVWGVSASVGAWVNLAGVGVIWGSTALLQVPAHGKLLTRFERGVHGRLVRTNWIRTVVWTARALGLLYAVALA